MVMSWINPKAAAATLTTCAFACLIALPILADDKEKAAPKLKGWGQLIDPDRDCEVTAKGGSLQFKVLAKLHDYSSEIKVQNAPRVLRELKGDFIVEVKVSGEFKPGAEGTHPQRGGYHGAGLIVIKDKDNYISLHRGSILNLDGQVHQYANFELRKGGERTNSQSEIQIPDEDTYLRLERRGNRICNATGPDGVHWTSYEPIELEMPETIQFGFVGINTSKVPLSFKFLDLAVFTKAEAE